MLDLRFVSENLSLVTTQLARRGASVESALHSLGEAAQTRRKQIQEIETLRSQRNEASQAMASLDKSSPAFQERREKLKALGDEIRQLEEQHREVEAKLADLLLYLPNLPSESTPSGVREEDNPVVRTWGKKPAFDFEVRDHVALGQELGMLDFERAAKISGSRFVVLKGLGARLERALIQWMLDLHGREHGYQEIWPPVLLKAESLQGTGQLPKFAADVFRVGSGQGEEGHAFYLSPTAEVSVTNLHAGEILEDSELPLAYVAYAPCFRSEAGSYGRDTRGMIRQHQFDKVELVRFCRPEEGEAQLERLTRHAEAVLQGLGLHYRVVEHCAGELGFSAHKAYDLEVWLPGQQAYREISSCSWCSDFQARRAQIRYRPAAGAKPRLLHTLNGSGLAVGRTMVALLEQGQRGDGSVALPEALWPYMGGLRELRL